MRCLSGGFCLSLAVLTFGVQGVSGSGSPVVSSAATAGAAGQPGLGSASTGTATAGGPAPTASGAVPGAGFTTDRRALVAFARSTVRTATKDGVSAELNVASAGLQRPAEGFLMAPLESLHETSPFGLRISPLSGTAGEFHWGQDYAAECGTRVYAADAGVVRAVGWHPWGGGNRVEIDHGNGLITTYNHLEAIAVKKGDSVRVGEVIARVGTTGSSTGCHLHFETILNGVHKDPHDWTLLPITQTDQLGSIEMTSYAPDAGLPSNASLGWAIPVSGDGRHEVTGGFQEIPVPAMPWTPAAPFPTATPTPSVWNGISPTSRQSGPAAGTSQPQGSPSTGTTTQPPTTTAPPTTTTAPPTTTQPPTTTAPPTTTTAPDPTTTTTQPPDSTTTAPAPTTTTPPPEDLPPAPTTATPPPEDLPPAPTTTTPPPEDLPPAPPPVVEPAPPAVVEPAPALPTIEPSLTPVPTEPALPTATPDPSATAAQ